jgi:hypothetical protein
MSLGAVGGTAFAASPQTADAGHSVTTTDSGKHIEAVLIEPDRCIMLIESASDPGGDDGAHDGGIQA